MLRVLFELLQVRRDQQERKRISQAVAQSDNVIDLVPRLAEKKISACKDNIVDFTSDARPEKPKDFSYRSTPQF